MGLPAATGECSGGTGSFFGADTAQANGQARSSVFLNTILLSQGDPKALMQCISRKTIDKTKSSKRKH